MDPSRRIGPLYAAQSRAHHGGSRRCVDSDIALTVWFALQPPAGAKVGERVFWGEGPLKGDPATPNQLNKGAGKKAVEIIIMVTTRTNAFSEPANQPISLIGREDKSDTT